MTALERYLCTRCGQKLRPDSEVWLELDMRDNTYHAEPVQPEHSQGGFAFGPDCARAIEANGGAQNWDAQTFLKKRKVKP